MDNPGTDDDPGSQGSLLLMMTQWVIIRRFHLGGKCHYSAKLAYGLHAICFLGGLYVCFHPKNAKK
jgi:hypothetical protein